MVIRRGARAEGLDEDCGDDRLADARPDASHKQLRGQHRGHGGPHWGRAEDLIILLALSWPRNTGETVCHDYSGGSTYRALSITPEPEIELFTRTVRALKAAHICPCFVHA